MTDFEQRIGPRRSPSPETQPLFTHMTWTRPGYKPSSPKKTRAQCPPLERNSPYRSRSDGEPSLLLRMDAGAPHPSTLVRTDPSPSNHRSSAKLPLSERIALETSKDTSTQTLALGNHRVEPLLDRESATRRGSLFEGDTTIGESSENMDICGSERPGNGVSSFSRPSPCNEPQLSRLSSSYSLDHSSNSTIPDGFYNMSPSSAADAHDRNFTSYPNHTESHLVSQHLESLSRLPLKDRLAPLVIQNANLRFNYNQRDQHEANYIQGRPSFNEKNVDSALTPDVCKSIVSSLITAVMQLEETDPTLGLVHNTNCPVHTKLAEETTFSPISNNPPPSSVSDTTPSQTMPSVPLLFPAHPAPNGGPSAFRATMHQKDNQTFAEANGVFARTTSPRPSQASPGAYPRNEERAAIPIPISAAFFNNAPFLQTPNLPSRSPSNVTSQEYARRLGEKANSSRKQLSSPNERPHKRPRSRSPPASFSHRYYKNNDRRRGRDAHSPSPPSCPGRSPPTSPSYQRRHQFSPHGPRRSRSPPSRRSPSPRQSRSPQRRKLSYSSSSHYQSISTYHRGPSPTYPSSRPQSAREYSYSRRPPRENSDTSLSSTSTRPMPKRYSSSRAFREPYQTASQREQYQEPLKRDDERDEGTRRRHNNTWEGDGTQQHSRSNGQIIVDKPAIERQTIAEIRRSPTALPTPPASATSPPDHSMEREQSANMSDSAKSAPSNTPTNAGNPPQQGAKLGEVPSASVKPGAVQDSARTHANDLPEKEEVPHPWQPFNNIPGIWLLNEGSDEADVFEHTFEVTKEMALKWHLPLLGDFVNSDPEREGSHLKLVRKSLPTVSWKLKCVPLEALNAVRHTLESSDNAKEAVHQLVQFQSHWPSEGKLLVEVNPGHDIGKTLFPKQLGSGIPFVELNHYVHEGLNLIRFIQLEDMSKRVFILYATSSTNLQLEHKTLQQEGTGPDYELSPDNLQYMLQKSRLDNKSTPSEIVPLFMVPTGGVRISLPSNRVEENNKT